MRPRVYGSVLTGTDDDESDLDLLVDATETTTLFTLSRLEHAAQELLGVGFSAPIPLSPRFPILNGELCPDADLNNSYRLRPHRVWLRAPMCTSFPRGQQTSPR